MKGYAIVEIIDDSRAAPRVELRCQRCGLIQLTLPDLVVDMMRGHEKSPCEPPVAADPIATMLETLEPVIQFYRKIHPHGSTPASAMHDEMIRVRNAAHDLRGAHGENRALMARCLIMRKALYDTMGTLHVIDGVLNFIGKWHLDPNFDMGPEVKRGRDARSKAHHRLVAAADSEDVTPNVPALSERLARAERLAAAAEREIDSFGGDPGGWDKEGSELSAALEAYKEGSAP